MSINTTGTLPPPIQQSFNRRLLSVPVPNMIHNIPAMRMYMPREGGTTLRSRRYNPLDTATVPLGNGGIDPAAQLLSAVDIDCKLDMYGTFVYVNEQVTLQNQDPVLNEAAQRLGVSLRQTEDELSRDMLAGTAAAINCVNGVNGDNPTNMTRDDISDVIRVLLGNNAKTIMEDIQGENRFGTSPTRDAYFGLTHTDWSSSADNIAGFIAKTQYPNDKTTLDAEWGSVSNVRFLLSSIGHREFNASALGNTVYSCFVVGMEAYSSVYQDGATASFLYRPAIYDGPLAQNISIGYKMMYGACITNDEWVINLRYTL